MIWKVKGERGRREQREPQLCCPPDSSGKSTEGKIGLERERGAVPPTQFRPDQGLRQPAQRD